MPDESSQEAEAPRPVPEEKDAPKGHRASLKKRTYLVLTGLCFFTGITGYTLKDIPRDVWMAGPWAALLFIHDSFWYRAPIGYLLIPSTLVFAWLYLFGRRSHQEAKTWRVRHETLEQSHQRIIDVMAKLSEDLKVATGSSDQMTDLLNFFVKATYSFGSTFNEMLDRDMENAFNSISELGRVYIEEGHNEPEIFYGYLAKCVTEGADDGKLPRGYVRKMVYHAAQLFNSTIHIYCRAYTHPNMIFYIIENYKGDGSESYLAVVNRWHDEEMPKLIREAQEGMGISTDGTDPPELACSPFLGPGIMGITGAVVHRVGPRSESHP